MAEDIKNIIEEDDEELWICPLCGYVHGGEEPPKNCPMCGAPGSTFNRS
ncbi:MAG: hypothetical protein IKV45_01445 [Firmicutes bacterium]|nr:hypothetical protein [Bacillota bacterium]